ncbi:SpoIID/LytB domain-containing protein [bacterium]|nr:SpoIID/LytB domain-containing protein [bacterium]
MSFILKFKTCFIALFSIVVLFFTTGDAHAIKIGLCTQCSQVYIASSVDATMYDAFSGDMIMKLSPMKYYFFKTEGNQIAIKISSKYVKTGSKSVTIKPDKQNGYLSTKKAWYRGEFIITSYPHSVNLINKLPLEMYLKGVVPSEMSAKWPQEALKAQAIAARSYAIANLNKHASQGYDLDDTPKDQAYGGASAERDTSNRAVKDTEDIVLVYNKQVIPAYYCASAGGQTTNSGGPWSHNLPFLKSVPSYDEGIKKHGHGVGMSQHGANNLAKMGYNAYSILNYYYKDIKFAKLSKKWDI